MEERASITFTTPTLFRAHARARGVSPVCSGSRPSGNFSLTSAPARISASALS